MSIRYRLRRLEHDARGDLASFVLEDGSRHYYDPASGEMFLHNFECLRAGNPDKWPEPPELLRKLIQARDPASALDQLSGGGRFFPYDPEILITERRLEPASLVAGRDVHDQEVEDLSE